MSRRSRARRQKSPRKCSMKWLGWGSAILALVVVTCLFFGYNAVRRYLRSDDFREMLGSQAGDLLKGDAAFAPFEWDGWDVSTNEFNFTGHDGIQNMRASQIEASVDIGAVWSGVYRINDVRLGNVELIADFRAEASEPGSKAEVIPVKKEGADEAGFWDRFLPDTLELSKVDVAHVNGRAATDDGIWSWKNVAASLVPGSGNGVYDITLRGGHINSPISLVDQLTLREAKGRYSADNFYLLSSQFDALERAQVSLEGGFALTDRQWRFNGEVIGARVEEVIAEDWRQRLMGPLAIEFNVIGRPEHDASVEGTVEITDGVLTALPVLDRIAAYANTVRFRRLSLSDASLEFSKQGSRMELNNIRLASEGLMRVEGEMRLNGDVISVGRFRLGITPGTLAHIPGAETKVFERGELGLLWTPVTISGTLDSPQEDLSERLIAAAGERMFEMIPETGQWVLKHGGGMIEKSTQAILSQQGVILGAGSEVLGQAGEVLIQGSDIVTEGTEKALETGGEIFEEGVGTLFDLFGRPLQKEK